MSDHGVADNVVRDRIDSADLELVLRVIRARTFRGNAEAVPRDRWRAMAEVGDGNTDDSLTGAEAMTAELRHARLLK